jgi:hypothetical protein
MSAARLWGAGTIDDRQAVARPVGGVPSLKDISPFTRATLGKRRAAHVQPLVKFCAVGRAPV